MSAVFRADAAGARAAVAALRAGEPVIIPTDTVYGLAVIAGHPEATEKLFVLKRRPVERSIAVLVADLDQAKQLGVFSEAGCAAALTHWPGALTLVVDRHRHIDSSVGTPEGTVGVRCPGLAFVRDLAATVGPLATTSANLSGEPTPAQAAAAADALDGEIAVVIDGGPCRGVASTVARIDDNQPPTIFRQGGVAL